MTITIPAAIALFTVTVAFGIAGGIIAGGFIAARLQTVSDETIRKLVQERDKLLAVERSPAMTDRDFFASDAMAGLVGDPAADRDPDRLAASAYQYADAMMAAGDRPSRLPRKRPILGAPPAP